MWGFSRTWKSISEDPWEKRVCKWGIKDASPVANWGEKDSMRANFCTKNSTSNSIWRMFWKTQAQRDQCTACWGYCWYFTSWDTGWTVIFFTFEQSKKGARRNCSRNGLYRWTWKRCCEQIWEFWVCEYSCFSSCDWNAWYDLYWWARS